MKYLGDKPRGTRLEPPVEAIFTMVWSGMSPPSDHKEAEQSIENQERYEAGSEDYQVKKLGFGIRVVDLKEDIVEGIWISKTSTWFDVQEFINR